ncbi:MAG: FKBP-type peptidyl-prolyl cis-trans isomerase [Bacteroidales bacterium]|nr:FKBP-type peptidyl-prolyl cis-trans isomerase [Bacteroidales bacterium]
MKKTIFTVAIICLCNLVTAQNDVNTMTLGDDGVRYKIEISNPQGRQLKEGDLIIGRYEIFYDDSLIFSCMNRPPQPAIPVLEQNRVFKGDLMDGLKHMREGETALFAFAKDSMAKYPTGVPADLEASYIYYRVAVDSLTTLAQMQREMEARQAEIDKQADSMRAIENEMIETYLQQNSWDKTKKDGIYVKHLVQGSGRQAKDGDVVQIHYIGQLLDGKVFDTSVEDVAKENGKYNAARDYKPLEFKIGAGQMIPGFEIAAKQLKQGGKATVLLPSDLAYGSRDLGDIKPFSPLLFTIELVKIVNK